jgi:hypothetical protein
MGGNMKEHVEGTFEVTSWDETPAQELEGALKVSLASIGQRFSGGVEAETVTDTVMTYRDDGTADFLGYQRVVGQIGGRKGSFVLQSIGTYDGNEARSSVSVVPGSGTADLVGIDVRGTTAAPHGSTGTFQLDYELA